MTCPQLKAELRSRSLKLSGNKSQLIQRLEASDGEGDLAFEHLMLPVETEYDRYGMLTNVYNFHQVPSIVPSGEDISIGRTALRKVIENDCFNRVIRFVNESFVFGRNFPAVLNFDANPTNSEYLVYCVSLCDNSYHKWPNCTQIKVNRVSVPVIQSCTDGRHRNTALLERPCSITLRLRLGLNSLAIQTTTDQLWAFALVETAPVKITEIMSRIPVVSNSLENVKLAFGDGEIVFNEMLLDLRCPISFSRIQIPAKGRQCTHVQCFDLEKFLNYQMTAKNANWKCFKCQKSLTIGDIVIDDWVQSILRETGGNVVEYFKDGKWKPHDEEEEEDSEPETQNKKRPYDDLIITLLSDSE